MFYYRKSSGARAIKRTTARIATTGALLAYPLGAALLRFGSDTAITAIIGYGLILGALLGAAAIFGTTLQRIVGEEGEKLDEYELKLRARAMWGAYGVLSALALLGVFYAAVASDQGWWVPQGYDDYNGLVWGVFLYGMMLPSACLAWLADPLDLAPAE